MKRKYITILFFLVLIAIWQILTSIGELSHELIPSPLEVVHYLINATLDGTLPIAIFVTIDRLFEGYLAGIIVGIPLGFLNARYQLFEDTLGIVALGLQTLPSICWAPLAIIWFGQTEMAIFFIVFMGSVWSIALAAEAGVKNVPPIYIRAAKTLGSKGFHTWLHVIIPASLPFIISGMKQGWAFAWRSLMAAEIYITILTGFGLGFLLHYGRELHSMDTVVGIMLIIIFIGLLMDKLLFSPLEKYLQRRWGLNQETEKGLI